MSTPILDENLEAPKTSSGNRFQAVGYGIAIFLSGFITALFLLQKPIREAFFFAFGYCILFFVLGLIVELGSMLYRTLRKRVVKNPNFWFSVVENGFVWWLFFIGISIIRYFVP